MKKILVVDDCLMAQELISEWIIQTYAIEILLASNVSEALACLEKNLIDFVICDYEMPDGKGLLVLNYLKENILQIPLVLFSGNYELRAPIIFPLIEIINDKSYEKLFDLIKNQRLFLENIY
jgi:CheY-like chemotaxis protein